MGLAILRFNNVSGPSTTAEQYMRFLVNIITGGVSDINTLATSFATVGVNTAASILIPSGGATGNWQVSPGQWFDQGYTATANTQRMVLQLQAPCVNTSYTKYAALRLCNFHTNNLARNTAHTGYATLISDGVVSGQPYSTQIDYGMFNGGYGATLAVPGYNIALTGLISNVAIGNYEQSNNIPNLFTGSYLFTNSTIQSLAGTSGAEALTPAANNESYRPLTRIAPTLSTGSETVGNAFSTVAHTAGVINTLRAFPPSTAAALIISWSNRHLFMFHSGANITQATGTSTQLGIFEYPEIESQRQANVAPFVVANIPSLTTFNLISGASTAKTLYLPVPGPSSPANNTFSAATGNPAMVTLMGGQTWDGYKWNTPFPLFNLQGAVNSQLSLRYPDSAVMPNSNTIGYIRYGAGFTNITTNADNGHGISNFNLFLDTDNNYKYIATPLFFSAPKFNINYASLSQLSQVWYAPAGPGISTINTTVNIGSNTYLYCRGSSGSVSNSTYDNSPHYFVPYF